MRKITKFMDSIEKKDSVIIIFDDDGDGISSAVLLRRLLKKRGVDSEQLIGASMSVNKAVVDRVKSYAPNKIIFLDLAIDQQPEIIEELKKYAKLAVIDHHQMNKAAEKSVDKITYFNPLSDDPRVYQSTSYLTYNICSELEDMSDSLWLAAVGIVSDYDLRDSGDIVEEIKKKHGVADLKKSIFKQVSDIIMSSVATKTMTGEQIVRALDELEQPEDIVHSRHCSAMLKAYSEIQTEITKIETDTKNMQTMGKLLLYQSKSKYGLSSVAANIISERNTEKLVVVWRVSDQQIKISARCQGGTINAAQALKDASIGLKASAGGHKAAAGATLRLADWDVFRTQLNKIVNK